MTKEEIQAVQPEEILPQKFRDQLSPNATKLFVAMWYRAAFKNSNVQVVPDEEAGRKARIPYQLVLAAQTKLMRAGLMTIVRLRDCARYEFVEMPEAPASESDDECWQRYTNSV